MLFREKLRKLLEHKMVQACVILLIVVNAITLGMETSPSIMAKHGEFLHRFDLIILSIFVIELSLRIIAMGPRAFFRDSWCLFDFFVILVSLAPHGTEFSVLRTLRILRVLRLISIVPAMRRVVSGLIASLSGIAAVSAILALLYYVFSVIATHLFASYSDELFGSIGRSMFTLFQIMTLEGWADIARPLMELHPYAWVFFVVYILVSTFTMLNLFIGVMVNAMQNSNHNGEERRRISRDQKDALRALSSGELLTDIQRLKIDVEKLTKLLENKH